MTETPKCQSCGSIYHLEGSPEGVGEYKSIYIVRNDFPFDYPESWAFEDYEQATMLRDRLNAHRKPHRRDGEWHVEEEPVYPTATEALEELVQGGYFDE